LTKTKQLDIIILYWGKHPRW